MRAAMAGTSLRPDLFRSLGVLCETPRPEHAAVAEALGLGPLPPASEYTQVLALGVVPYAAVYLGADGMLGGEAADRVAGFWRAVGYVPPAEPDHLAALLGLYAALTEGEGAQADPARAVLLRRARAVLLWEHLLSWVPAFARALTGLGSPFYAAWADLLVASLQAEAANLEEPGGVPRALAEAPGLPAEVDGVRDLARDLVVPVRSGVVLTRRDLALAARALGLGLRVGERAFVLMTMLEQDAVETLDWLAGIADAWAHAHRDAEPALGGVATFWADRATTTATACRARRADVEEVISDAV